MHQEFAANAPAERLESALEHVCVPGTTWTVSAQGKLTVSRASLTPQCKVWYHFLKTHLMPSTHVQTVSKDHILLLDSIISGQAIDVGRIIFQNLGTCAAKKCGSLWFPSLVTSLCARNGVPMFDTEEQLLCSSGVITKNTIARLLHGQMAEGPTQPPRTQNDDAGQAPQAPTSSTAAASSNRDSTQADLINSLQMLERRMSLAEQRDVALKKSLQKNFTKPIFPFPEFPDGMLEPIAADEVDEEDEDDQED
ncbi:hypothetical protein TIFTF001_054690 [Ficus carica]|uniref:Putative plant transposon protein domain-containing protein n=1 Tax=Ficus carica TaxID=3494 RepID=A0AA88EDY1_FICCA|nr:hypothetical protein TIFTF001_054690 [Ficus carica]